MYIHAARVIANSDSCLVAWRYPDRSRKRIDIPISHPVPHDIHRRRARIKAPESLVFEYVHILLTGEKDQADGGSRGPPPPTVALAVDDYGSGKLDCRDSVWRAGNCEERCRTHRCNGCRRCVSRVGAAQLQDASIQLRARDAVRLAAWVCRHTQPWTLKHLLGPGKDQGTFASATATAG
jgi:hypothetical protein